VTINDLICDVHLWTSVISLYTRTIYEIYTASDKRDVFTTDKYDEQKRCSLYTSLSSRRCSLLLTVVSSQARARLLVNSWKSSIVHFPCIDEGNNGTASASSKCVDIDVTSAHSQRHCLVILFLFPTTAPLSVAELYTPLWRHCRRSQTVLSCFTYTSATVANHSDFCHKLSCEMSTTSEPTIPENSEYTHSFVCSFIYSFIHSLTRSFIRSFIHLYAQDDIEVKHNHIL